MDIDLLKKKYKIKYKKKKYRPELISFILDFIKERKLIVYGGYAIDVVVRHKSGNTDALYDKNKIPDIDVLSRNFLTDIRDIGRMIKDKYGLGSVIKTGITGKTRKLFVDIDSDAILDISLIEKYEYNMMKENIIEIDGIKYADPQFLKIHQYQNLVMNIFKDMYRIEKAIEKIKKLEKWFVVSFQGRDQPKNIEIYSNNKIKDIGISLEEINTGHTMVIGGDYAYEFYYSGGQKVDFKDHEIILYCNTLIQKLLRETGKLRKPNYRIMPLKGEQFYYNHKGKYRLVTKMMLLYQYYYLKFYHDTNKYDYKIVTLFEDPDTFEMYTHQGYETKNFPKILYHGDEPIEQKIKKIGTEYIK